MASTYGGTTPRNERRRIHVHREYCGQNRRVNGRTRRRGTHHNLRRMRRTTLTRGSRRRRNIRRSHLGAGKGQCTTQYTSHLSGNNGTHGAANDGTIKGRGRINHGDNRDTPRRGLKRIIGRIRQ